MINFQFVVVSHWCSLLAGSDGTDELWKLMVNNQTSVTTEQSVSGDVTCTGGFSRSIAHTIYSLGESEAAMLDPHEAMLLHCTRECIKSAGFIADSKQQHFTNWGVFAGLSSVTSGAADCVTRVFNFTGPTMAINTERTSLSALNVACLHLKLKQCRAAVVCGARVLLSPSDLPDLSSSSSSSSGPEAGFPQGEGCAAVLLMSVGTAKKFNRRVLAVIKATASNGDYPPSQRSQTRLLKRIFHEAGVTSKDVVFVEADLKGTRQESSRHLDSIQQAFSGPGPGEEEVSTITGSVKVNIGDLGAASGIAGLVRAVMVLEHAQVPGSSCSDPPEPTTSNQRVITFPKETTDLSSRGKPLAGAISCFGSTGSNEAAVIQQYSILPHMAGVSSWLVFGADHMIGDRFWLVSEASRKSSCYTEVFGSLKTQFPLIRNALVHFNQTFQMTCEKYRFKPHQRTAASFNVAVLKLYYGIVTQLLASGIQVSVLGGTNATNEIVALLFAGCIDLSTAILFMCCKCENGKRRLQSAGGERSPHGPQSGGGQGPPAQPCQVEFTLQPAQSDQGPIHDPAVPPTLELAQPGQDKHTLEPTQPDQDQGPTQEPTQPDQGPTQDPTKLIQDPTLETTLETTQPNQGPTQEPAKLVQDPTLEPTQPSPKELTQVTREDDQGPTQEPAQPSPKEPTQVTREDNQDPTQEPAKPGQQEPSEGLEEPLNKSPALDKASVEKSVKIHKQSSKESVMEEVRGLLVRPSVLVKLMTKPKIPVFSCIKKRILRPALFRHKSALTQYATELATNIGKPSDPSIYMHFLVGKGKWEPLLHIMSEEETVETKDGIFTISFKHLHDANSSKYLRDKYFNLRKFSDGVIIKKEASLGNDAATKEFYERYPFRRIVEGLDKPQLQIPSEQSSQPKGKSCQPQHQATNEWSSHPKEESSQLQHHERSSQPKGKSIQPQHHERSSQPKGKSSQPQHQAPSERSSHPKGESSRLQHHERSKSCHPQHQALSKLSSQHSQPHHQAPSKQFSHPSQPHHQALSKQSSQPKRESFQPQVSTEQSSQPKQPKRESFQPQVSTEQSSQPKQPKRESFQPQVSTEQSSQPKRESFQPQVSTEQSSQPKRESFQDKQ